MDTEKHVKLFSRNVSRQSTKKNHGTEKIEKDFNTTLNHFGLKRVKIKTQLRSHGYFISWKNFKQIVQNTSRCIHFVYENLAKHF